MADRFAVRADRLGFSVFDTWTGETAIVDRVRLAALPAEEAERRARLLSRLSQDGDRSLKQ